MEKQPEVLFTAEEFLRIANNFYNSKGLASDSNRIALDAQLVNYIIENRDGIKNKKYKIALCCICLNPPYWQYAKPMIDGVKQFFLPGHQTDVFLWSDIPESTNKEVFQKGEEDTIAKTNAVTNPQNHQANIAEIKESFRQLQEKPLEATIFPTEPIEWPMPTLMRYHLMIQQEEVLKDYDYIFYCDIDMKFVNVVGDEILGQRLTAVCQPMYFIRKEWWTPTEPNEKSAAYIKRLGKVINDGGRPRFMPLYLAGGLQGGKSKEFIEAMKVMKKNIDKDFGMNYVAMWNDESHWNKYLFDYPDDRDIILTPSYTYPDSLIKEYFEPMWGQSLQPKLVTLTKKFSFQPGSGEHLAKTLEETKQLRR